MQSVCRGCGLGGYADKRNCGSGTSAGEGATSGTKKSGDPRGTAHRREERDADGERADFDRGRQDCLSHARRIRACRRATYRPLKSHGTPGIRGHSHPYPLTGRHHRRGIRLAIAEGVDPLPRDSRRAECAHCSRAWIHDHP